jgi:hypothetical protein
MIIFDADPSGRCQVAICGETDIGTYATKVIGAIRDFEKTRKIMHLPTGNSTVTILKHGKKKIS